MVTIWKTRWAIANFCAFIFYVPWLQGLYRWSLIPESTIPVVGASGAVAGVMGDIFCFTRKAKLNFLFIFVISFKIFSLPASVILAFWFTLQLLNGFLTSSGAVGVAYWAHIGGFVAGLLLCWPLFQRSRGSNSLRTTDGHTPHPDAEYRVSSSRIPKIRRGPI